MEYRVNHNEQQSRFEAIIDGKIALVDYINDTEGVMTVTHTEVPKELEGQGIAARLTKTLLEYAVANQLKVRPLCPYTKAYIERHSEYSDIVVR